MKVSELLDLLLASCASGPEIFNEYERRSLVDLAAQYKTLNTLTDRQKLYLEILGYKYKTLTRWVRGKNLHKTLTEEQINHLLKYGQLPNDKPT